MNVDPEHHILNIKEEEYPEKYRPLIRRLQSAILEPEMRKQMKIEDGILDELRICSVSYCNRGRKLPRLS